MTWLLIVSLGEPSLAKNQSRPLPPLRVLTAVSFFTVVEFNCRYAVDAAGLQGGDAGVVVQIGARPVGQQVIDRGMLVSKVVVPANMMFSPAPPSSVSAPKPPKSKLWPLPAVSLSLPPPPIRALLLSSPVRLSAAEPPRTTRMLLTPPPMLVAVPVAKIHGHRGGVGRVVEHVDAGAAFDVAGDAFGFCEHEVVVG